MALCVGLTAGQKAPVMRAVPTPSPAPCVLKRASAPHVRGFFLGENLHDIELPNILAVYRENAAKREPDETVLVSFFDIFPAVSSDRVLASYGFGDVTFMLHFFDERIKAIFIDYNEYDPDTAREFVASVVEKLHVPAEGWRYRGKYAATLKCQDFSISVWTGRYEDRPIYKAYPMLSLNDDFADEVAVARKADRKRKAAEEAAEKKRQEEIKRKTFKP